MTRATRLVAAGSVALLAAAAVAPANDWPQFRGPNRDAVSAEVGLLQAWPTDGPKLLWHAKDVGDGYSTPAVVGDRLYLMSSVGVADEFARAVSATDGKTIWSVRVGKVGNPNQKPNYPGARTTPAVDGDLLYALGSDGDLVCLQSADGKERWRKSLRADFGGKPGEWAYSDSPLIDGDRLIVTPGGPDATVVALDKKTGDVAWKAAVPGGDLAAYASAVSVDLLGTRQIVQFVGKGVVGLDAKTGALLWRFDETSGAANMTTPVVHDGVVYTAGGLGSGGAAKIAVDAAGKWSATKLYADKKLPQSSGGVVRVGDYLYGTTQTGLACVDFKTGKMMWQDRSVGPAAICVADGRLYVYGEGGDVALVEPSGEEYRERGRFTPPDRPQRGKEKAWAHPVVAGGKLYFRDGPSVWCYDVRAAAK